MTPEGKVKKRIRSVLDTARDEVGEIYYRMPPSNMYGATGTADFVGVVDGIAFQIEAKAGRGKMTKLQELNAEQFQMAGGVFFLIDGTEESCNALDLFLREPHRISARPPAFIRTISPLDAGA